MSLPSAPSLPPGSSPSGPAIFGFIGLSGSGKTTLLENVIASLTGLGFKVSTVKHTHHNFDLDRPGKDSFRHREAGAAEVMLTSSSRWALLHETRAPETEPALDDIIARLSPCDLVLVEGFKSFAYPKIEVHRPSLGKPLACLNGKHPTGEHPNVVAIACDAPPAVDVGNIPLLNLNNPDEIVAFVINYLGLKGSDRGDN